MTDPVHTDPLDGLRRANPVDVDRLPSASLARIRARIQEETMTATTQTTRKWSRLLPATLAGAALAAVAAFALFGNKGIVPGVGPGGSTIVGSASCVEQYSLSTLAHRAFAFDGTVTAIAGDEVTFKVNKAFHGSLGDSVTLTATGMTGTTITSLGGPTLGVGQHYLVAGDAHFAWSCGFTQPYDAGVAAQWAQATTP